MLIVCSHNRVCTRAARPFIYKIKNNDALKNLAFPFSFNENNSEIGDKIFTLGYPRRDAVKAQVNYVTNELEARGISDNIQATGLAKLKWDCV